MGLFSSKLSAKTMAPLCRQLATAYDAGIPIVRSLQLTAEHVGSKRVERTLTSMASSIQQGATLAEAAKAESAALPEFFAEVIAAGETGGRLDALLRDLADYYESWHAMWRSILASMAYPGMQLACAWFLGTFALGIVKQINPMSSKRFILGNYLSDYARFQIMSLCAAALFVAVVVILSRLGLLRSPMAFVKNHFWPIRSIARKFALARFFRSMALLVGAGLDLRRCIERSAALTMNPPMERDLLQAIPVISQGGTLVEAFSRCRCLSRVGREMIAVGEQSGKLDAAMHKVAEYHFAEAQAAAKATASILRVLIILAMGVLVGAIVISFYGNLYGRMLDDI